MNERLLRWGHIACAAVFFLSVLNIPIAILVIIFVDEVKFIPFSFIRGFVGDVLEILAFGFLYYRMRKNPGVTEAILGIMFTVIKIWDVFSPAVLVPLDYLF